MVERDIYGDTIHDVESTYQKIMGDENDPRRGNVLEILEKTFGETLVSVWLIWQQEAKTE